MIVAIALFIAVVGAWRTVMVRFGGLGFWQLASRNPDLMHEWALQQPGWHVLRPGDSAMDDLRNRKDMVGPFQLAVPRLGGRTVFFADQSLIEAQQEEFLQSFGGPSDTRGQVASAAALLYPIAAIWSEGFAVSTQTALSTGLQNLGYLLLASGVIAGRFGVLGLHYRIQTVIAAVVAWGVGILLGCL